MATMYSVAARDRNSSQPAHIQNGAQAHTLFKLFQKAPSLLRVCLRFLRATASRSVPSVEMKKSINDRRRQDCCDSEFHSTLSTKLRKVPIVCRRAVARSGSSLVWPRTTAARRVSGAAFPTT